MEKFLKDQQIPLTQVIDPNTGQAYYAPQNVVYQDKNNTGVTYLKNVRVDSAITASYALTASYAMNGGGGAAFPFTGSARITGSLNVIGTTTVTGNIIPSVSKSFSLGSSDFPFKDIFISSGSLIIASDTPGAPSTTLSNTDGNILISAGGMQLVGSGSFNAATGSFRYISGSMTQVGNYTQFGNYVMQGNKTITGSFNVSGSTKIVGNSVITGSLTLSSGSTLNINDGFYVNGNKQFNYGQFSSTSTQSGSANTAYSMMLDTTDFSQGVSLVSGSRLTVANNGLYNIQFSSQLHTTSNEAVDFSIWFAMTGSNIANSNTDFSIEKINGGGFQVAALNFLTLISSGSYIELKYSKTTTNGQLQAKGIQSTPTRPSTPSVIVTVTQIA
jgi:hypothetical protein